MTAELAVETASTEVLPENVVRLRSNITITAPHESLATDERMRETRNYQYFMAIYRNGPDTQLYLSDRRGIESFMDAFGGSYELHIIRQASGEETETRFYYREVEKVMGSANPWRGYDWFKENFRIWAELLPVMSETPGMLAYYQTPAKRARNIRTPIKPGRFLKKFFGRILDEQQIQDLAMEWANLSDPKAVTITQDADEIEDVYKSNHLGSCMWFNTNNHTGQEHPARVYAGPDLAIAYIGGRKNCQARTLVWPEKKIFLAKSYGDYHRLYGALEHQGYQRGERHEFTGARLQRIEWDIDEDDRFVLPYLDTHERVRDEGDYLVLTDESRGNFYARNTNGISGFAFYCNACDEQVRDETTSVQDGSEVCDHCLGQYYFQCEISNEYQHTSNRERRVPDGYNVSRDGVRESSEWFYCDRSRMYYPESDYTQLDLIEGDTCESDYAEANGFYCEKAEQWSFQVSKRVELLDGKFIHLDSFNSREELDEFLKDRNTTLANPSEHPFPLLEAA